MEVVCQWVQNGPSGRTLVSVKVYKTVPLDKSGVKVFERGPISSIENGRRVIWMCQTGLMWGCRSISRLSVNKSETVSLVESDHLCQGAWKCPKYWIWVSELRCSKDCDFPNRSLSVRAWKTSRLHEWVTVFEIVRTGKIATCASSLSERSQ